jgi:hypothetical protein
LGTGADDARTGVFRQTEILMTRTPDDSLVNGAVSGFAIGAGFILGATLIASIANYYIDEGRTAKATLAFGACGAGVGALIDRLHKSQATIYEKPASGSGGADYHFEISPAHKRVLIVWQF